MTQSQILAWNTGRQYTREGQRLMAELTPKGTVIFADHDRMIYGETKEPVPEMWPLWDSDRQIRWVQRQYDTYAYHMSSDAMSLKWSDDLKFPLIRM